MPKQIVLDGTTLEGGGQILRLSTALASLAQQPLKITNIRGNRSGGGGLKLQHLTGVQWLSRAVGAPTRGVEKKSKVLEFFTDKEDTNSLKVRKTGWEKMERVVDIGSPGAIGLILQAILPFILFSGATEEPVIRIKVKGGTNVSNSPSVDYLQHVLCPMLEKIGVQKMEIKCSSRGWSTGRTEMGEVEFVIRPFAKGGLMDTFDLKQRGDVTMIQAIILAPKAAEKHFRRELATAMENTFPGISLNVDFEFSGHEKRLYLLLVAHTSTDIRLGRDHLFQERISSLDNAVPKVVARAVEDLKIEINHGGCVDEFMRDQLVVFQVLAKGKSDVFGGIDENGSLIEPSLHAKTAMWVAEEMLGVEFDEENGCEGVGWVVGERWKSRKSARRQEADVGELTDDIEELKLAEI